MKTNTHDQNQINLTTPQAEAQGAKALCDRILLGLDQHAADLRTVRQLDGAGPQPPQRIYPGTDLERFIKKQLAQAHKVFAVYEAGPCGFVLARQLAAWGVTCYVIRPMKLDTLGKGVNTDKTDAAELVSRLDRYLAGNRKAFAVVRVPTPAEEQRQCVSRQREQLRRERQRLAAMGKSLMLCQGHHCKLRDWWHARQWAKLQAQLPTWLIERLAFFRTVLQTLQAQLDALTTAVVAQVPKLRPLGCGPLTLATAQNEVGHWGRFTNRRQVGSLSGHKRKARKFEPFLWSHLIFLGFLRIWLLPSSFPAVVDARINPKQCRPGELKYYQNADLPLLGLTPVVISAPEPFSLLIRCQPGQT